MNEHSLNFDNALHILKQRMVAKRIYRMVGSVLELISIGMAWYFYDLKLAVIIFVALWANNISRGE